jgi:hypothetical protein
MKDVGDRIYSAQSREEKYIQFLAGKPVWKRIFGRHRPRYKYIIKIILCKLIGKLWSEIV